MPFTLDIVENGRVIAIVYTDPWTLTDVRTAIARSQRYFDQVAFPVHTLVNISATRMTPSMPRLRDVLILGHQQLGGIALVGASRAQRTIIEMIFKFYQVKQYAFFRHEDQAWSYLRQVIAAEAGMLRCAHNASIPNDP